MMPEIILCLAVLILIIVFVILSIIDKVKGKLDLKEVANNIRKEFNRKDDYIGEFYCNEKWIKFKGSDIIDRHDEYRKIRLFSPYMYIPIDYWIEDLYIFYYGEIDIYEKLRKKIENKIKKEKK